MVKIHGRYRTDLVTLNFNRYYKLTVFYHHYSIPEPEKNEYFKEERVVVGDEYKLEGLLTLPKNNKKAPVVILVHGSGFHNADESYGPNRIFAEIAHSLAKQGIATLRYNERYFQHESLADGSETVYTEAIDDACIAVKQMVKDNRVNNDKIFIAGHSLGGMVAPKIAELCSEVSGIISLAGSPRKLIDIGREQIVQQLMESAEYKNEEDRNKDIEEVKSICDMIENLSEDSNEEILKYSHTYWRSANNLNVKSSIEKLSIPMLILQGKDDFQVYADKDYVEWQRLLNKRNNCHFKLYDGLNHFFIPAQGAGWNDLDKEYGTPNHVDQRVLNDMSEFINMYSK